MLAYDIPYLDKKCRACRARFIPNGSEENRELNPFPCKPPSRFSGSSEIVFRQLVTSTKCWLDFQLLNAGIGIGVIVVFYPLSSSYV